MKSSTTKKSFSSNQNNHQKINKSKLRGKILESQPLKQRMLKERKWAFKTPLYIKIVIKLLVLGTFQRGFITNQIC